MTLINYARLIFLDEWWFRKCTDALGRLEILRIFIYLKNKSSPTYFGGGYNIFYDYLAIKQFIFLKGVL